MVLRRRLNAVTFLQYVAKCVETEVLPGAAFPTRVFTPRADGQRRRDVLSKETLFNPQQIIQVNISLRGSICGATKFAVDFQSLRSGQTDFADAFEVDLIAGSEFASAAIFWFAIDQRTYCRQVVLDVATALDFAGQLEQLAKCDVFAAYLNSAHAPSLSNREIVD